MSFFVLIFKVKFMFGPATFFCGKQLHFFKVVTYFLFTLFFPTIEVNEKLYATHFLHTN